MAKKEKEKKDKKDIVIRIKKLKANYELHYDYFPLLTEYIKRFPKEHRGVRVDNVIALDGTAKDDWVRIIREVEMGKILTFLIDNGIKFVFENVSEDSINKLRNEYIEKQRMMAEALREKADALDITGEDYSFMLKPPFEYQKKAIKFFEINKGVAFLGDEMGVGKSLPSFAYATKHRFRTLVVCPSSLKFMWRDAVHEFTKDRAFVFNYQPKKNSDEKPNVKNGALFHIINYEALESYINLEFKHKCSGKIVKDASGETTKACGWEIVDTTKKYKKCPQCQNSGTITSRIQGLVALTDKYNNFLDALDYDLIIVDECHRIKNEKTTWTKIMKKSFRDIIPRKLLLSGTPLKSRPYEFFSPLNFLFPQQFNSGHEFGVRHCGGHQTPFGWDYSGASNLEDLVTTIAPFFLRRLKKHVLKELPPKTFTDIIIEMTDVEARGYAKIEKDTIKELASVAESGKTGNEISHIEKTHKLFNYTAHIKLKRAIEYIQDIVDAGEKVVVFSEYLDVAAAVKEHFKDICVIHSGNESSFEQNQAVVAFQKNKSIKVFSGTIMSAGVGITLTAASKLIFIGSGWTPADNEQCEDRIHRATTTADNVQIIKFLVMNTVDIDREELLKNKSQTISKVVDNKNFQKNVSELKENIAKSMIKKILKIA